MTKCGRGGCDGMVDETGFCVRCHLRPATGSGITDAPIEQVPEEQRYCPNCMHPVGRGHAGRPGREHGFCMTCAAEFDFRPPLAVGDKVAQDRYRAEKILGAGGFGWAYLAQDDNLERPVVLKTLILDQVAGTVERERTVLTNLEHPNIVRIFDFVADSPRCLVLDYVEGRSPAPDDPLDDILDYGHQILEALRYLHGKGFLHCDIKPDNVLRVDGTVRLIDFGAIRKIDSTEPLGPYTPLYAPPPGDPDHQHPTEGFDLFCVGMTLGELCRHHLRKQDQTPGMESLLQLLDRATDVKVPERRFFSAQRFAEQLRGVRRKLGHRSGESVPSTTFAAMTDSLDGGLGMIPKLDHWLNKDIGQWPKAGVTNNADAAARPRLPSPFTTPAATEVVVALPTILVDPADASDTNVQERLSACHGALLLGNAEPAREALDQARLPLHDWRRSWYEALIALSAEEVRTAAGRFEQVWKALPGEIVPTFAQGLCEELQGHRAAATRHYENVVRVDGSLAAAGFGLARCRLADGDRDQAIKAVDQVTERFGFDRVVRIARVRVPVAVLKDGLIPGRDHLEEARHRLADLDIAEPERVWLEAEIAYAELGCAGWAAPAPDQRRRLAQAIRKLAAQTPTQAAHTEMIDRANAIGPPIRFSW